MSKDPATDEIMIQKLLVAVMAEPATSLTALAKQFKVSSTYIKRILDDPKFKDGLERVTLQHIAPLVAKVKTDLHLLGVEAVRVIRKHLNEDSLEAAKIVLKIMALENPEEKAQDTTLTVILPGAKHEQVIEVVSEETSKRD